MNLTGLTIFIKSYNEKKKEKYFLEVDIQYPEKWHELQNDLLFLTERMKIEKAKKLFANLHDKILIEGCG